MRMTGKPANAGRKQDGTFASGHSGNARGKRPGTRHKTTQLAEQLMERDIKDVVQKVVEAARAGDMQAAKIVLDRIAPARRGRPVALTLPKVLKAEDVPTAIAAVIEAMSTGVVSPEEAAAVSSVIEGQRRALELVALESRVAALEQKATVE
jgi:hypothetical protein